MWLTGLLLALGFSSPGKDIEFSRIAALGPAPALVVAVLGAASLITKKIRFPGS